MTGNEPGEAGGGEPSDEELHEARLEAARYRSRLDAMSHVELIGSILGRAQIIEEAMRMLIVAASDEYSHPREVKGTFGRVLTIFRNLYRDEKELIGLLEVARDARNEAAHTDLLVAMFIGGLLSGQAPEAVDRFQRRSMRKTVEGMDWTLREILRVLQEHPVDIAEWLEFEETGDGS